MVKHRRELLSGVAGDVLEIGFGTGLNLPHYPGHIRRFTVIDPNPGMHRKAQKRISQSGIDVDARRLHGEELPFPDASFDSVVSAECGSAFCTAQSARASSLSIGIPSRPAS